MVTKQYILPKHDNPQLSFNDSQFSPNGIDELRERSTNWSLEGDSKILELMSSISKVHNISIINAFVVKSVPSIFRWLKVVATKRNRIFPK